MMPATCTALTAAGGVCSRMTLPDESRCYQHGGPKGVFVLDTCQLCGVEGDRSPYTGKIAHYCVPQVDDTIPDPPLPKLKVVITDERVLLYSPFAARAWARSIPRCWWDGERGANVFPVENLDVALDLLWQYPAGLIVVDERGEAET